MRPFPLEAGQDAGIPPQSHVVALKFDRENALIASGAFGGTTTFGGARLSPFAASSPNAFLALFDAQLQHMASTRVRGYPRNVILSCDGAVYLVASDTALRLR